MRVMKKEVRLKRRAEEEEGNKFLLFDREINHEGMLGIIC